MKGSCPTHVTDCVLSSPFSWDIAGGKIVFMLLQAPIWFAIICYIEHKLSPAGTRDDFGNYVDTTSACRSVHNVMRVVKWVAWRALQSPSRRIVTSPLSAHAWTRRRWARIW